MTRLVRAALGVRLALGVALALGTAPLRAQSPVVARPTALEGVLSFVWGDPAVPLGVPRYAASLRVDGAALPVVLDLGGAAEALIVAVRELDGHRVRVELREAWAGLREDGTPTTASLRSIAGVSARELTAAAAPAWARTTRPYAVILCKFADVPTEPLPASRYRDRYGAGTGGAESFYQEVSNGRMSIAGTTVFGWYTMPSARSAYVGASADLVKLATECAAAADADVDFRQFGGIAFHFNAILDCCAWGGSISLTLDGLARSFPTTWMPPWAGAGTIWHEMGHSFGLPHSSGPYGCTYDSWWDVMSEAESGLYIGPEFGSGGAHFIAFHKELLGLIPRERIAEAGSAGWSGWLVPNALPSNELAGYQLLNIPLADRPGARYTVEVRRRIGSDARIPGNGVLITIVDPSQSSPSQVVDADGNLNPNDEGAIWSMGEVFSDQRRGVRIAVDSMSGDRYFVSVTGGSAGPVSLASSGIAIESAQGDTAWRKDSLQVLGSASWTARAVLRLPWLRIDRPSGTGGYVTFATRPSAANVGVNIDTIRVSGTNGLGTTAVVELGVIASANSVARLSKSSRVLFKAPSSGVCDSVSVLLSGSAASAAWTASVRTGSSVGIGAAQAPYSYCSHSTAPVGGSGSGWIRLFLAAPASVGQSATDTVAFIIATTPATTLYFVSTSVAELAPTVTLSKTGGSRSFSAGELLSGDSVRVTITSGRAPAAFRAYNRRGNTLQASSFFDGAVVRWNAPRATVGTLVDTISFCPIDGIVNYSASACASYIDTLRVADAAPQLRVTRMPRQSAGATVLGQGQATDSLAVEVLGATGASQRWSVTTTLRTNAMPYSPNLNPGSGYVKLHWILDRAAPGTYVDTVTVTAFGVPGSPVRLIDTLVVAPAPAMVGDVDAGGSIDATDALLVLRSLVGLPVPAYARISSGDANCDGIVSASDASMILQFNVGLPLTGSCLARRSGSPSATGARATAP